MLEIIRNRTIRPSTRLEKSKTYKIDTKTVGLNDILVVNIDHETKSFFETFRFKGSDIASKSSISFRVSDSGTSIDISWSGATPVGMMTSIAVESVGNKPTHKVVPMKISLDYRKSSFEPISHGDTSVLILGTMPSDKSLQIGEYYGHPKNKFWNIVSKITNNDLPRDYCSKRQLLKELKSESGT